MEEVELKVETRESLGTNSVAKLKRDGKIPAVVYSGGTWSTPLTIDRHHFERATAGKLASQIYALSSESTEINGKSALVKSLQIDPLKQKIEHIDLQAIEKGQKVSVPVPLELIGTCAEVANGTALLNQTAYDVEVECLPSAIPAKLTIDVSNMTSGSSLHAKDVPLPAETFLQSDPRLVVVNVIGKRGEKKDETAQEEAPKEVTPTDA